MAKVAVRNNRKQERNRRISEVYQKILKRLGSVRHLTPNYEIYEEIAYEFNIEPSTVSRIITKGLKD